MGWGEGLEPKLIKGPDVLVSAVERLRSRVPELVVLLTGPARGYVRSRLERLGIPHRHALLPDIDAVAQAYDAIDLCLVTSRDEGGPRAVLESMAVGVPLVSTRVGQATDLVRHGENGWLVDVEDVDGIVHSSARVAEAGDDELTRIRAAGRATAEENSYPALRPALAGAPGRLRRARRAGGVSARARCAVRHAGRHAGRACSRGRAVAVDPASASSTATTACPPPGERRLAAARRRSSGSRTRFPNHPHDFTLRYLGSNWAATRPRHAAVVPARAVVSRSSSTRTASGTRRGRGTETDAVNKPLRALLGGRGARPLPERVLEALRRRVGRLRRPAPGRSSRTPSTSTRFTPAADPPAGGPVLLLGGDQTQAYRLELAVATLAARAARSTGTPGCS